MWCGLRAAQLIEPALQRFYILYVQYRQYQVVALTLPTFWGEAVKVLYDYELSAQIQIQPSKSIFVEDLVGTISASSKSNPQNQNAKPALTNLMP